MECTFTKVCTQCQHKIPGSLLSLVINLVKAVVGIPPHCIKDAYCENRNKSKCRFFPKQFLAHVSDCFSRNTGQGQEYHEICVLSKC